MLNRRLISLKNLKIGVDGGGRPKNTRQPEGGQVAAGTQHLPLGTRQKFWQLEKRGHDFESFCRLLLTSKTVLSQGFKTIFLLKVLPHSDKLRFDFFHLEKTYIQDTHTPTREEGRQVNVFL